MGENQCGDAVSSDAQNSDDGTTRRKLGEARGYLDRIGRSLQGTDRAVASLESFIDQINRSVERLQRGLEELSHSTPSGATRKSEMESKSAIAFSQHCLTFISKSRKFGLC